MKRIARALYAAGGVAAGLAGAGLLVLHTAARRADFDYGDTFVYRRLWADFALGTWRYLDGRLLGPPPAPGARGRDPTTAYRAIAIDQAADAGIRPWQFWRTLRVEPFAREPGRPRINEFDDQGRAMLLAMGFRFVGGVSPYLILWLGALAAVPALVWGAWELFDAGEPAAGVLFPALVASSCFVVDVLSLPRSAVGFYVVGLLTLVPFAVYATRPRRPDAAGMLARAAGAGLLLGTCAVARAGVLFLVPGFLASAVVAAWRVPMTERETLRRALLVAAAALLLMTPYLVLRPPQRHETWASMWAGLGDFDRVHGHTWSDEVAESAVRRAGGDALKSPLSETVFRRLVLDDIRHDPIWFTAILARRVMATVAQSKLWPLSSREGLWMARSQSPNEGLIDKYYTYTATVDFFGVGARCLELPVPLLLAPTLLVLAISARPPLDARLRAVLLLLAVVAAAALALPVLVTTAGAQEPQSFALVYLLGAALLPARIAEVARRRREESPPAIAGDAA